MSGNKSPNVRPKRDGKNQASDVPVQAIDLSVKPDRYAAGYDFLFINSPIDDGLHARVMRAVTSRLETKSARNKRVVVILVTYGGSADEAYRIGRFLQSTYDEVVAFIPSMCKSAGTLLAISAGSIVMSAFGELGPLDVQLRRKDEIFGRRSGLITRAAISDLKVHTFELFEHFMLEIISHSYGSISFKVAADISSRTVAQLMAAVYEQVNPDTLGQDFRDLNVATKYCERLNSRSRNIKERGIQRLVHEYPSHDFVIDAEEAKEIFQRVDTPTSTLYKIMGSRLEAMVMPCDEDSSIVEIIGLEREEQESEDRGDQTEQDVASTVPGGSVPSPGNPNGADASA